MVSQDINSQARLLDADRRCPHILRLLLLKIYLNLRGQGKRTFSIRSTISVFLLSLSLRLCSSGCSGTGKGQAACETLQRVLLKLIIVAPRSHEVGMSEHVSIELLSAALNAGSSSADKQIFLISQCGTRFPISAELARASTDYFTGALESGMTESGITEGPGK